MRKHIKYIYLPDLANKFLLSNPYSVIRSLNSLELTFSYVFSTYNLYSSMILKLLPTLESIGINKCSYISKYIKMAFGKKRIITRVFITVKSSHPAFEFFQLCMKKPLGLRTNICYKTTDYFISPGYGPMLLFPGWERKPIVSLNLPKHNQLINFFHKAAYLD